VVREEGVRQRGVDGCVMVGEGEDR
jgi:hypothetical protein